jgi:hypothetical protein
MRIVRYGWLWLLLIQSPAWAEADDPVRAAISQAYPDPIRREYLNTSRFLLDRYGIVLEGSADQVMRISAWLDHIIAVPYGHATLEAILNSGHRLTIRHSEWALHASGRTQAPATDDLINGFGADVVILFDADIPDGGSHWVFDAANRLIEFTAVQNLFHELAHARHLTNGTWRYWDSEAQAVEEENMFRAQLAEQQGKSQTSLRSGIKGVQFWNREALVE